MGYAWLACHVHAVQVRRLPGDHFWKDRVRKASVHDVHVHVFWSFQCAFVWSTSLRSRSRSRSPGERIEIEFHTSCFRFPGVGSLMFLLCIAFGYNAIEARLGHQAI